MNERSRVLRDYYRELWWGLSSDFDIRLKKYSIAEKRKKEKQLNDFMDNVIGFIESFPKEVSARAVWKEQGYKYIDEMIATEDMFKLGNLNKAMKDDFICTTKAFIKEARAFDKDISYENIGQAMRNVWIVNMLQQAFGEKLRLTKSIFAYSMLYPYTDNYLDSTDITEEVKFCFNERFTQRLMGKNISASNQQEECVYKLIERIEEDYHRENYKEVYNSLMLIQDGQIKSLSQQDKCSIPYEKDILGISIEKGGASVLVDGNLVRGTLSKEEEIFCYGYGFLLQLGDDLQDVQSDRDNGHLTVMSQLAGSYKLDSLANKLMNLTTQVVDEAECFICKDAKELKELIKSNCIYMILFAIIDNKRYFSKEYVKIIEEYLPFRIGYCVKLKSIIMNKFKRLKTEYHGVPLEQILLEFIE